MTMEMAPPILPGFSLRVQLFSSNAYASGDKPIRLFRVVTSPEATVREFCQEAARIHEINYGQSLAIKKCQDDQEFDITQGELLGNLFANTATIRLVQAAEFPSIRDSIPPSSGLRFDPAYTSSRKRVRSSSPKVNGEFVSSSNGSNKRQRILDLDPDQPLPSRESSESPRRTNIRFPKITTIFNSQESRPALSRVSESPEPLHSRTLQSDCADEQPRNAADGSASFLHELPKPSPPRNGSQAARSQPSTARAKSTTYHIQRATERGRSVSTAATTPLSGDQPGSPHRRAAANGSWKTLKNVPGPRRLTQNGDRSPNENTVYGNIESEDEGDVALRAKKASLKIKNSPICGLQGTEWANKRFNTPPTGRQSTQSRDEASNIGELPLTPSSREQNKKQKEKRKSAEIGRARISAVDQRERETENVEQKKGSYASEVTRVHQQKQEKQEWLEVEGKRAAILAETARLKKEREEGEGGLARERHEREQRRQDQEAVVRKTKQAEERCMEQERIEHQIAERVLREKADVDEARRIADAEDKKERDKRGQKVEIGKVKYTPQQGEPFGQTSSSAPRAATNARPASPSPHQKTPGSVDRSHSADGSRQSIQPYSNSKRSAMKAAQPAKSSPPTSRNSCAEISFKGVGIEAQMPLPRAASRRVSFVEKPEKIVTPVRSTSKGAKSSNSKSLRTVPPERQSHTPILPPALLRESGKTRSATPHTQTKQASSQSQAQPEKKPSPPITNAKSPPLARSKSKKVSPPATQATALKSAKPTEVQSARGKSISTNPVAQKHANAHVPTNEYSDEEEEKIVEAKPEIPRLPSKRKPSLETVADKPQTEADEENDEGEEEGVEGRPRTASKQLGRDSRSPVVFSRHPPSIQAQRHARSQSDSSEDEDEVHSGSEEVIKEQNLIEEKDDNLKGSNLESNVSSSGESSPRLPPSRPVPKHRPIESTPKSGSSDLNMQDEINRQLTSSMRDVCAVIIPASKKTRPAPRSSPAKPKLGYGASLTSLNSKKPNHGRNGGRVSAVVTKNLQLMQDAQESEEESDNEGSGASSDESDVPPKVDATVANAAMPPHSKSTAQSLATSESETDSSSDGSSTDSEREEEIGKQRIREELQAKIASMKSPSTPVIGKISEAKKDKKSNRYITGYSFSQPV